MPVDRAIDLRKAVSEDWLRILFMHVNLIGYEIVDVLLLLFYSSRSPLTVVERIDELESEENCQNITPVFH